jgi:hypothetical protein
MTDKYRDEEKQATDAKYAHNQVAMRTESHMVYELKQQREYHIRKLMDIQKAIDAVNLATD